ncbi:carbohydrate kinase family protein, partial [Candidatus Parcubacteria bacterium]|nr:carbohydrate kinase family protein [Candidatus Parcubacteria bacterium]
GGATRDMTFVTDKGKVIETPENLTEQKLLAFEYGAKIKSEEVFFNFGGGACNTAATFAKLGLNVAVNCRVGNDDDGESTIKNLKKLGIGADLIQVDEDKKTGFSLVVVNKNRGDRVIFAYKGASDFLEVREREISKTKWIYLTSLAGNWEEDLGEINKTVENSKIKLAWNPGATQITAGKNKLENTLKNTEILIINKDEAIELVQNDEDLKLDFNEINDVEILAKNIKNWGPKIIVITDGPEGAYVYDGENVLYSSSTPDKKIDSTGAGDSFGSALVGGYILTDNFETALKYGIINSGNVVGEYGAQNGILNKEKIEKKLGDVKVSYL